MLSSRLKNESKSLKNAIVFTKLLKNSYKQGTSKKIVKMDQFNELPRLLVHVHILSTQISKSKNPVENG